MALHLDNLTAHGMLDENGSDIGPVGKPVLEGFYFVVMRQLCPVLVTDIQVAVGNYAAERYHAIRTGETVPGNPECVNLTDPGFEFDDCDEDGKKDVWKASS